MFWVGMLTWWYGDGLAAKAQLLKAKLDNSADFFSIKILVRTLFSPYRQISAAKVSGPINQLLQAFFDQLVSRLIGFILRTLVIWFGLVVIALQLLLDFFVLILWLVMPFLPIAGVVLWLVGGVF